MPGAAAAIENEMEKPVEPDQSLKKLIRLKSGGSLKRALDLFSPTHGHATPPPDGESKRIRTSCKISLEYKGIKKTGDDNSRVMSQEPVAVVAPCSDVAGPDTGMNRDRRSTAVVIPTPSRLRLPSERNTNLLPAVWHRPWKNYRVISGGHLGWVRSIAFDPSNTWFCTGSADRTIKIWDVASGRLNHTLTGHIGQVRGLAVSQSHTYMFSAGDDKLVKCWDLEQNKAIRSYHGHLSGVYSLALHPTIDLLLTGGRDSVCRVWDVRTAVQAFALSGHDNTVSSVLTCPTDPQVITASHDSTIKFWDLRYASKTMLTLTHHKKSVRALAKHPTLVDSFASASPDNIKKFNLPNGELMHNIHMNMLSQHHNTTTSSTIINSMAINQDGVMVAGGDNGTLSFFDWNTGLNFQQSHTIVQPGSLECEAAIFASSFDLTGSRLVTCEADKTIKMWKQDENATPITHPRDITRRF